MEDKTGRSSPTPHKGIHRIWNSICQFFTQTPLLGWIIGGLIASGLELLIGFPLARTIGLNKAPVLFGVDIALKTPLLLPATLLYDLIIYVIPIALVMRFLTPLTNRLAGWLLRFPMWVSALIHMALLYLILDLWTSVSDYRVLIAKLIMIAIMVTLSLNVVNGYMGEFSCSHPGFMALGAYMASFTTVVLFIGSDFGPAILPESLGPLIFPIALILGGVVASLGALLVAIPSFRTRGDYLAIISLAFLFIVKSLFENLEFLGGARGFGNQPNWASLPVVFVWTMLCIWIINNFVQSTMGKALNAVRDNELAADAMTVDTRKTKMITFLFAAFWAGVAGGLFAHVLRYVNPGTFGLQKLAEVLAMVYFGGLNSVTGSIVGAIGYSLLSEMLRPLELFKWIIIPLLLILVMIYRPTGLFAFREFDLQKILQPKSPQTKGEVENVPPAS
ncbi:MAG: branched-chain amino acid ABC transporter permease [Anaerolineales bacterium]|nr:branched-chain amino acid ABC transporter permease [Anaerolineales bacterium]